MTADGFVMVSVSATSLRGDGVASGGHLSNQVAEQIGGSGVKGTEMLLTVRGLLVRLPGGLQTAARTIGSRADFTGSSRGSRERRIGDGYPASSHGG
jgi:hypothetical protein